VSDTAIVGLAADRTAYACSGASLLHHGVGTRYDADQIMPSSMKSGLPPRGKPAIAPSPPVARHNAFAPGGRGDQHDSIGSMRIAFHLVDKNSA
jgi:hypothetical protein